jgi:hypothetical protein
MEMCTICRMEGIGREAKDGCTKTMKASKQLTDVKCGLIVPLIRFQTLQFRYVVEARRLGTKYIQNDKTITQEVERLKLH